MDVFEICQRFNNSRVVEPNHECQEAEKNHRHLKSLVEVVESLKSVTFPKLVADKGAHRGLHSRAKHVAKEKEVYDNDLARLVFHTDEACSERHLLPNPDTQSGGRDQRKRKHSVLQKPLFIKSCPVKERHICLLQRWLVHDEYFDNYERR